jgi:hypothetical protein
MKDLLYKNTIFFYWDGNISESRLKILKDCLYSTRLFNADREICLISNTLRPEIFEKKYEIRVESWSDNIFQNTPISENKIAKYINCHPRELSDLLRLIFLWKYGGSYVDTDDLAIKSMSNKKNLICRSYDPHTSFYNKISSEDCVSGNIREIRGYDHINMFPRNDCWQNWEPESEFITDLLTNKKFVNSEDVVSILGDFSWQSLINETCIRHLDKHETSWNYGLTLLYLFEDFVATSSNWDKCIHGGELCDLWNDMKHINTYEWGFYKTDRQTAIKFYTAVCDKYPFLSHMWLHSKDNKKEWLVDELDETQVYSVSTWIYDDVKKKIKNL